MDPFGNNLVQLTNLPGEDGGARWSPDGSKVAFQRNVSGNFDIFVMNADGTDVRNLTNHPNRETFAAWSPDGTESRSPATATSRCPSGGLRHAGVRRSRRAPDHVHARVRRPL